MAERISVDVEGFKDELEAIAASEERTVAQMARILLRGAVLSRYPPPIPELEAVKLIRDLVSGNPPSNCQIVKAAQEMDIPEERLIEIRSRLFPNVSQYSEHNHASH